MEVKIYLYKSSYISILLFDIHEPKSAMEVKIDSYKSRQISIFVYDMQDPKSAKFAMDVKMDSYKSVSVKFTIREAIVSLKPEIIVTLSLSHFCSNLQKRMVKNGLY